MSYGHTLAISTDVANSLCARFESEGVVCPPQAVTGVFTTAAVDNIDHNPSSNTSQGSFRGTAISLLQHPTQQFPGTPRAVTVIDNNCNHALNWISLTLLAVGSSTQRTHSTWRTSSSSDSLFVTTVSRGSSFSRHDRSCNECCESSCCPCKSRASACFSCRPIPVPYSQEDSVESSTDIWRGTIRHVLRRNARRDDSIQTSWQFGGQWWVDNCYHQQWSCCWWNCWLLACSIPFG